MQYTPNIRKLKEAEMVKIFNHLSHLAISIPRGTCCTYTPDLTTLLTWLL